MAKIYSPAERIAWMKSLHGNPAGAAMILETADKKLLIVKANYKKYWTLPGGVIDKGESPLSAAIREVKEEVGLVIDPERVRFAGLVYCYNENIDIYRFIFRSTITEEQVESIALQESEIEDYVLETVEQILEADRTYSPNIITWSKEEIFPNYSEEEMLF